MRPSLTNRQLSTDAEWVTRDQIVFLYGISYDLAGKIPLKEVPRVPAGKSHIFHRQSLSAFLLKVASSGISLTDYCRQGTAAPRARKRGRPPKVRPVADA